MLVADVGVIVTARPLVTKLVEVDETAVVLVACTTCKILPPLAAAKVKLSLSDNAVRTSPAV